MAITGSKTFTLGVNVEANARQAINELDKLSGKAKTTATAIVNGLESMAKISAGLTAAVVTPLALGARAAINMYAEVENAQMAFESMLGSAEKAKKLWGELVSFSTKSPLPLDQLRQGAQLLLAFGHGAEEIIPKIKLLGTVTKALNLQGGMEQAVRALEDLKAGNFNQMQLGNLGITRDLLSSKGIKFNKAGSLDSSGIAAYEAAFTYLEERFGKMADRADQMISTRFANIADKLRNQIAPAIGEAFSGSFGELVDDVNVTIDKVVKALADPRIRTAIDDSFTSLTQPIKNAIDWMKRLADETANDPKSAVKAIERLTSTIKGLATATIILTGATVGAKLIAVLSTIAGWAAKLLPLLKYMVTTSVIKAVTDLGIAYRNLGISVYFATNGFKLFNTQLLITGGTITLIIGSAIALYNELNKISDIYKSLRGITELGEKNKAELLISGKNALGYLQALPADQRRKAMSDIGIDKTRGKDEIGYWEHVTKVARNYGWKPEDSSSTIPTGGTASDSATKTKKKSDDLIEAAKIYEAALANVGKATNLTEASCADAVGMILESATGIEGLSKTLDDRAYQLRDQLRSQYGFKDIPLSDVRAGDIIFHLPAGPESGAGNHTIVSSGAISGVGTGTVGVKGISGGDKSRGISGRIVSGYKNTYDEATTYALRAGGSSLDYGNAMAEIEQYFTDLMNAEKELEQIRFDRSIAELDDLHRLEKEYQRAYDDMKVKREAVKNALAGGDPLEVTNARLEYEKSLSAVEDIERQVVDENYKLVEAERELAEARREHLIELDKWRSDGAAVMKGIQDQIDALNNKFEAAADFIKQLSQGLSNRVSAITGGATSYRQSEYDKASQAYEDEAQKLADFGYSTDYINERMQPFADQVIAAANNLNIFNKAVASIGAGIVETLNVSIGEALTGEQGTKLTDVVKDKIGAFTDSVFGSTGIGGMFGGLIEGVAGGLIDQYLNKAVSWVSKLFGGGSKKPVEVNGVPVVWVANFDQISRGFTLPEPAVYSGRYGGGNTVRVSSINVNVSSDDDIGEAAAEAVARSINRKLSAVTRHRK